VNDEWLWILFDVDGIVNRLDTNFSSRSSGRLSGGGWFKQQVSPKRQYVKVESPLQVT
jgi:hypothetical protein